MFKRVKNHHWKYWVGTPKVFTLFWGAKWPSSFDRKMTPGKETEVMNKEKWQKGNILGKWPTTLELGPPATPFPCRIKDGSGCPPAPQRWRNPCRIISRGTGRETGLPWLPWHQICTSSHLSDSPEEKGLALQGSGVLLEFLSLKFQTTL